MIIELETGQRVEVPEGTTPAQIDELAIHLSAQPKPVAPTQPQSAPQTSRAESLVRGAGQGVTLGFGDEAMGGIAATYAKLMEPELFKNQSLGQVYDDARDSVRQDEAIANKSHPYLYGGAQMAGSVPTAMALPAAKTALGMYGMGTGLGAVTAYGNSDSKTLGGQATDVAYGAVAGAGGTYLGNKVGEGIDYLANTNAGKAVGNTVRNAVSSFTSKAPSAADSAAGIVDRGLKQSKAVVEAMKNGATPEEATILARAQEFKVPLSRGDVTRSVNQQGNEDLALRGMLGDDAAITAQNFRSQQAQALKAAARDTAEKVSGVPYMDNVAQAGKSVQDKLLLAKKAEKALVTEAYKQDFTGANIQAKAFDPLTAAAKELSDIEKYPVDIMPSTQRALDKLSKYIPDARPQAPVASTILGPNGQPFTAPAVQKTLSAAESDNVRKYLLRLKNIAQTDTDRMGVQNLIGAFDKSVDDAITNNLVSGDAKAINNLKSARSLAREYFKRWKAEDTIQKIVENDHTPEQIVNLVRGYGQTGGNKQAALLVGKLGKILGKDSPEFGMLKQAQLQQVFGKNLDALMSGDLQKGFSAEEVRKNLSNLLRTNKSLADEYFSEADTKVLKDFLDIAYRATDRVPGAVNSSGTSSAIIRWGQRFVNQFGPLGRLVGTPVELVNQGMGNIKRGAEGQKAIESFTQGFKNPDSAIATALRNKIKGASANTGAAIAGSSMGSKQPLRVTVYPKKDRVPDKDTLDLRQFYK